jgi:hypothetical protein
MGDDLNERVKENASHNDFGEKIGGAKKDLWRARGLLSGDLRGMNEREADKYVKKDNVWKKPDYQALVDGGIPAEVIYYIKTVRDSLNTGPVYYRSDDTHDKRMARQMEYIDTVREIQSIIESVKTREDVFAAFNKCMVKNGYFEELRPGTSGSYFSPTPKGRANTAITDKLSKAMLIRSEWDYKDKIVFKAQKEQFGVLKDDKVPKGYAIRFNDGKHTWSADNDWKPNTYYIVKGHSIVKTNFETREDALKWIQDAVKQLGGNGKKRFVPEQLKNVVRDGSDYRGGADATGEDYLQTFGFKGGEFGNWMTQNDRQASLNYGFDALKDLAAALKISDRDIAFQGTLSIAFGARGSGNFAAHYEPLRKVINLTKMNGAGSLAHEWWHGLDDYIGAKMGVKGYMSDNERRHPLFRKLLETIKYKPQTPEQAAAAAEAFADRTKRNAESWLRAEVLPGIKRSGSEKDMKEYEALKDAFLLGNSDVESLNVFKKRVTGRVIPKEIRVKLDYFERALFSIANTTEPVIGKTQTEYYSASKKMGTISEKDGGYWDSNVELTARAFAVYVLDTLTNRSDYLAGHAESAVGLTTDRDGNMEIVRAFPQGEERKAINAVFDELIAELKLQQILTHEEHEPPEQPELTAGKQPKQLLSAEAPYDEPPPEQPPPQSQIKPENERPTPPEIKQDGFFNAVDGQLSFFDTAPREDSNAKKPSILGGLSAALVKVAEADAGKTPGMTKSRETQSL